MSRSKRLNLVLDLVERTEQKAVEAFEMARRLWREDEEKLNDLQRYYEDYETSFGNPSAPMRVQDIVQQRSFLLQLAEAVRQQQQIVQRRKTIADNKQNEWRTAHLKRKSLQELIARIKVDEQKALSKKEEKMLDEWFAQTSQRRANESTPDAD